MNKEYINYHKHDDISSCFGMPDSATKAEEYIQKALEYGHTTYFTTNHGSMGDIFNSYSLCKKYGIHCYVGLEGYIVSNITEKDDRNYHIIIIPTTNTARKKLNIINSHAHIYGYYRKPRIILDELLRLDKNDVYITTACEAGIIRDEDGYKDIFLPLYEHFQDHILLEVQNHNTDNTKQYTKKSLVLHEKLGLRLIAANDSHAVDKDGLERRKQLLLGKHISYGDEDTYILDYPDYDTMFKRFQLQGILTDEQITKAIANTLIFKNCEELFIDDEIKMPTIYPELTSEERIKKLKDLINKRFKNIKVEDELKKEELPMYKDGLRKEMKIIEDTNEVCHTADYFLLDEKIVNLATTKYGGVITRTGRGSCGAFYTNRVLGLTQLDRFKMRLPSFPERFMSTARCIQNRAMPDVDINLVEQKPFVDATRELLGYDGCYPMIAYGTLKESEAFRNVCRSYNMDFSEFNDIGKNIDEFREDSKWKKYIDEAQKYIGVIVSSSVHPCAHVLSDKNILEEYGVVRCGENICAMITSAEADEYHILKNDYLVVSIWDLINEACNLANIPIPSFHNLLKNIENNNKVWDLVSRGLTCTVNQMDTDNGKHQAMRYKVSSFEEAAALSAAIRPSFDSWREKFLNREEYSTGSKELDDVLSLTDHYILYQENLMQYFEWLGITPAESIGLIKKISKKKIKEDDFKNLETRLRDNWIKHIGMEDGFYDTWNLIQSCMAYGYCSMHGAAVGGDACYSLYLKAYYPLEYFTVCFNKYKTDERKTSILTQEIKEFNIELGDIKFRHSKANYSCDKGVNKIYKGLSSIKYLNDQVAEDLYSIRDEQFSSFVDLLYRLSDFKINSNQLNILIKLDFFSEFGDINQLLFITNIYNALSSKQSVKKDGLKINFEMDEDDSEDLETFVEFTESEVRQFASSETNTRVEEIDCQRYLTENGIYNDIDCMKVSTKTIDGQKVRSVNGFSTKKTIKKYSISEEDQYRFATKVIVGKFSGVDMRAFITYLAETRSVKKCSISDRLSYQKDHLGYLDIKIPELSEDYYFVSGIDGKYSNKIIDFYQVKTGETFKWKVKGKTLENDPLEEKEVIKIILKEDEQKWGRDKDNKWYRKNEYETIVKKYNYVD